MVVVQSKVLYIFLILVTSAHSVSAREEWVDPHDMNIRIKAVRDDTRNLNDEVSSACKCDHFNRDKSSVHLRKVVGLINNMIYFDRRNDVYKGIIDIHMNVDDYDFLKKYLSAELNEDYILRKLSGILEKSIEKSIYSSYFFSLGEFLYLMLFNENILLGLSLIISLYILWKIQPHNYNFTSLLKIFLPLVYLADFVLRYRGKLEEVEVDKFLMYESFKSCDPDRLGWFDWIYNKFTGYCQQTKREFMLSQRAATHIFTPLKVISEQFDIFVNILKHLGAGLGSFMWAFIEPAPWYIKPILGLLSFFLVIIILLILGSHIFDISSKINLCYLFQLDVLKRSQNLECNRNQILPDSVSGENLKKLLQLKGQNNIAPIFLEPSNQKKISLPTFKTKSRFLKKKKITANTNNETALSIQKINCTETNRNCESSCDT